MVVFLDCLCPIAALCNFVTLRHLFYLLAESIYAVFIVEKMTKSKDISNSRNYSSETILLHELCILLESLLYFYILLIQHFRKLLHELRLVFVIDYLHELCKKPFSGSCQNSKPVVFQITQYNIIWGLKIQYSLWLLK